MSENPIKSANLGPVGGAGPASGAAESAAESSIRAARGEAHPDADAHKGAVEDDQPHSPNQVSMQGQLGHRSIVAHYRADESAIEREAGKQATGQINEDMKDNDTDFPEPGSSPEHSGQHR